MQVQNLGMDYKICDYFHIYGQKLLVIQEIVLKEERMVSHVSKVIKYIVMTSQIRFAMNFMSKIQSVQTVQTVQRRQK